MIDLYGMRSPNVQKVLIALEELGLPFRFFEVDVFNGEQHGDVFGALNPNRKVPVLVDDEAIGGGRLTVWESGAILIYLAEKTGLLLSAEPVARYAAIQWLMFQMAGIGPMFGQATHFRTFAPEPAHEYSRRRYFSEEKRLYEVVESRLAESAYLAGPAYSIADIAAWPWMRKTEMRGVDLDRLPGVRRWIGEIGDRPAVKRAMAAVATMGGPADWSRFKETNPDEYDQFLGRGRYLRT